MNIALILAAGVGSRMGANIPKQFLLVNEKPIIAHTLDNFQNNDSISYIGIVCKNEWVDHIKSIVEKYNFTKVKWFIEGGDCSHESISNGVFFLKDKLSPNDYVIVHDAVRPIVPDYIIEDLIRVATLKGNACSSMVCHPPIVIKDNEESGSKDIDRESVMLTASPQMFRYDLLLSNYIKAKDEGKKDFTFTSSLYIYYGNRIYFSKGTTNNIKITRQEDLIMMKALLDYYDQNK